MQKELEIPYIKMVSKDFQLVDQFNKSQFNLVEQQIQNESAKILIYALKKNEILIKISNMEDKFDAL